ncbi:MAG: hypothetical protein JRJ31_18315 [Deltaproteobacteria bacterium]|nr:hypothetical protein [Deltaproteobacteria bacterium]
MGFMEQDMYPAAQDALRRRYPASAGWEIHFRQRREGYEPDFVIEKKSWFGPVKRVIAEVKADCAITQRHVDQLNQYTRNLSGGNVRIVAKHLIVPAGADTSTVPDDIEVIILRRFKCV